MEDPLIIDKIDFQAKRTPEEWLNVFYDARAKTFNPAGVSLLMHLFSVKENVERQPLMVSTRKELNDFFDFMSIQATGATNVVIFRNTGSGIIGSSAHYTVLAIQKMEQGLEIINIDSLNNGHQSLALTHVKDIPAKPYPVHFVEQTENTPSRQSDEKNCSIFAIKDARLILKRYIQERLAKEAETAQPYEYAPDHGTADLLNVTPLFMKSQQSLSGSSHKKIVEKLTPQELSVKNRKGKNLAEIYDNFSIITTEDQSKIKSNKVSLDEMDKHKTGYILYFRNKYYQWIKKFIEENHENPEFLEQCTKKFTGTQVIQSAQKQAEEHKLKAEAEFQAQAAAVPQDTAEYALQWGYNSVCATQTGYAHLHDATESLDSVVTVPGPELQYAEIQRLR